MKIWEKIQTWKFWEKFENENFEKKIQNENLKNNVIILSTDELEIFQKKANEVR